MLLVAGYPRSGTTLLMLILHQYGMDIGYTEEKIARVKELNEGALEYLNDLDFYKEIVKEGGSLRDRWGKIHTLETLGIKDPFTYPEVIKHPADWEKGNSIFHKLDPNKRRNLDGVKAIICDRYLPDAVASMQKRRAEYRQYTPKSMVQKLFDAKFKLMKDLEERHIDPVTYAWIRFPKWVTDQDYFVRQLCLIYDFDEDKLGEAHTLLCDKGRVHYGLE